MKKITLILISVIVTMTLHSEQSNFDLEVDGNFYKIRWDIAKSENYLAVVNPSGKVDMYDAPKLYADPIDIYRWKGDVSIPDSVFVSVINKKVPVRVVANYAFAYSGNDFFEDNLSSITLPQTIDSIGYRAFGSCEFLNKIDLSRCSIRSLSSGSFQGVGRVSELILPENIEVLEPECLMAFRYIKSLTLPRTLIGLGRAALFSERLEEIICEVSDPSKIDILDNPFEWEDLSLNISNITIYVPAESVEHYESHSLWGGFGRILPIRTSEMSSITSDKESVADGYDLMGRRVAAPGHGLYIINGKKVIK